MDAYKSKLAEVAAVQDGKMLALMANSNKAISAELESAKQDLMEETKDAISTIEPDREQNSTMYCLDIKRTLYCYGRIQYTR